MGRAEPGARVAPQRIGGLVAAGGAGQFGQANKRRAVFKQRLQTQPWWRGLCNRAPREAARNIKNMLVNAEMKIGRASCRGSGWRWGAGGAGDEERAQRDLRTGRVCM